MGTDVKETGLTPAEAGAIIGRSAYTIKEYARNNRLPHYKVGNRYLFTRAALMNWIKEQEQKCQH